MIVLDVLHRPWSFIVLPGTEGVATHQDYGQDLGAAMTASGSAVLHGLLIDGTSWLA